MTPIPTSVVARAAARVLSLDLAGKEKVADVIFERQPVALAYVLALSRLGVPLETIDHVLHVLMVSFECFTDSGTRRLPKITDEMIDLASRNNEAMLKLLDAESGEERERIQRLTMTTYPEVNVLAYVVGYLDRNVLTDLSQSNEYAVRAAKTIPDTFVEARRGDEGEQSQRRPT